MSEKLLDNIIKKTIQPSYQFQLDVICDDGMKLYSESIVSCKIPQYSATKNTYLEGSLPRHFLTFSPEEAFELSITINENAGYMADPGVTKAITVKEFCAKNIGKIINSNGYHKAPNTYINKKIPITFKVLDIDGNVSSIVYFRRWSLINGAQDNDFGYTSSEAINWTLNFAFDYYELEIFDKKIKF